MLTRLPIHTVAHLRSLLRHSSNLLPHLRKQRKLAQHRFPLRLRGHLPPHAVVSASRSQTRHPRLQRAHPRRKLDPLWRHACQQFSRRCLWSDHHWFCAAVCSCCADALFGSVVYGSRTHLCDSCGFPCEPLRWRSRSTHRTSLGWEPKRCTQPCPLRKHHLQRRRHPIILHPRGSSNTTQRLFRNRETTRPRVSALSGAQPFLLDRLLHLQHLRRGLQCDLLTSQSDHGAVGFL